MSVDERRGPANPRQPSIITAGRVEPVGSGFPDWSPNLLDYRHSVVVAMKRAERDDETLEICPHCECEVDVTPAPHRPGCPGIGKPRASSASATSRIVETNEAHREAVRVQARADVEGLDLLEAMDDGEPLGRQVVDQVDDEPEPEPVLEEVAAVGELAGSGSAAADLTPLLGEPERAATSPNTAKSPALERWPREAVIEALQTWAASHDGIPPSSTEWGRATEDHPNAALVKRIFPSWADAVEAAGFPRPRRGVKPKFLATPAAAPARPDRIRVPGTGLAYRDADEAIAAADEVERDGQRVAQAARDGGDAFKASAAFARAWELAEKIRAAAGVTSGSTIDSSREGAADPGPAEGPRSPKPGIGERDDQQQEMRAPTPAASSHGTAGDGGSTPAPSPEAASRALVVAALAAARAFADALEQELARA